MKTSRQEYQRKYRAAHREEINKRSREYYATHKEQHDLTTKAYYASHKEQVQRYREEHTEELRLKRKVYRAVHADEIKAKKQEARQRLRTQFFDIYGYRCSCPCGCNESFEGFLTVGHLQNDGKKDRAEHGIEGALRNAINHPDHKRYATLCYNCNIGANTHSGTCPRITKDTKER